MKALEDGLKMMDELAYKVDTSSKEKMREIVGAAIDTKFVARWGHLISDLAIQAVQTVVVQHQDGRKEIDVKRYAKVEKISGGDLSECVVLDGVMFNKDITHPRMRRKILNPRVVLLDCPLEYKKGESQTNVECMKESDWEAMLMQEEEEVQKLCDDLIKLKPDVVMTEKGVSDLAQHFLLKANIAVIRRIRKTDNNRVAKACGATIVHRTDELTEEDVGTRCGLFKIRKIGDEYFTYLVECENPKACTVILRGGTKDVLSEVERNLQDAFAVTRNLLIEPRQLPGGGACEMEVAC